jgi:hypothetical protein
MLGSMCFLHGVKSTCPALLGLNAWQGSSVLTKDSPPESQDKPSRLRAEKSMSKMSALQDR